MKKLIILSTSAIMSLSAAGFQSIGYKSISMGGASVSNAKGDMAIYSNPALLAEKDDNFDTSIGGGITLRDSGAGQSISDIEELDFINLATYAKDNLSTLGKADLDKLIEAKDIMVGNDGSSLSATPHAHFSAQMLNFGVGVFSSTELTAKLNIDSAKNKLIVWTDTNNNNIEDETDIYTNLENNDPNVSFEDLINSYNNSTRDEYLNHSLIKIAESKDNNVEVKAVNITEIPIAYGHMFENKEGQLMVGIAAKYLVGSTYYKILDVDDTSALDSLNQDYTVTHTFGLDVGVAYKSHLVKGLSLGAVAKNINTPTFEVKDEVDYELEPSVRAGISYKKDWYEVAFDADLTENETFEGVQQMIGGGIELSPWEGSAFRAGLKTNTSNEESEVIYTAGLSLGIKWVALDVAAEIGDKEVTVNEQTYRQHMGVAVNLISRF